MKVLSLPLERMPASCAAADMLWPAWQSLARWEETSAAELGLPFGELIVLLWSLHRFGGTEVGRIVAGELFDRLSEDGCDPLLEDVAECAFALGAGWAEARHGTAS